MEGGKEHTGGASRASNKGASSHKGLVYVHPYTKESGERVHGYYRKATKSAAGKKKKAATSKKKSTKNAAKRKKKASR